MSAFADSSALAKLYADEDGHEAVRELDAVAASALARVEVLAALWGKVRMGELEPADAATLVQEFEADLFGTRDESPRFAVLSVAMAVLDEAAARAAAHGLRAYDAVQLASAIAVREADEDCDSMACFERELRSAAAQCGFALVPGG